MGEFSSLYRRLATAAPQGGGRLFFFSFSVAGWRLLPGIRARSPPGGILFSFFFFLFSRRPAASARTPGRVASRRHHFSFFFRRWPAASAPHRGLVASRRGAGGRGLRRPLPPTTPYPASGQPSLTSVRLRSASPCLLPAARQRAFGLPLSRAERGPSVRPASELPPLRGGDLLRALPRLRLKLLFAALSFSTRTALPARRKNGFPPADSVHCAGRTQ